MLSAFCTCVVCFQVHYIDVLLHLSKSVTNICVCTFEDCNSVASTSLLKGDNSYCVVAGSVKLNGDMVCEDDVTCIFRLFHKREVI